MCRSDIKKKSSRKRAFGKFLSLLVLLLATILVVVSLSQEGSWFLQLNVALKLVEKQNSNTTHAHTTNKSIHDHQHGNITLDFQQKTNNTSHILSDHNVLLCTQIRNEPPQDLIEWLTYYRLVYQVSGVCIIDDGSTIDYANILNAFDAKTIPSHNNRNQNFDLCNKCLGITEHQINQTRIFISDVDEYIYVRDKQRFAEYLKVFDQVSMNALNFAFPHQTRNRSTSLILQTTRRAPHYCFQESYNSSLKCKDGCWYDTVKSISANARVKTYLPHFNEIDGITIQMPCHVAVLHHYFVRSLTDFEDKFAWDANSNWNVTAKYQHVLENINHYTRQHDDGLKLFIQKTFPNYARVLQEYKNTLLGHEYNSSSSSING